MARLHLITSEAIRPRRTSLKATTVPKPTVTRDMWKAYQTLFTDHLESTNAAPMTIRTYGIAITQLGEFLRSTGMPADPTVVTREHLIEWMRFLKRQKDDDGQGT